MSSIVVTGAGGFVGRALVERLSANGDSILAVGRSERPQDVAQGVRWITANLTDTEKYEREIRGASAVLHLAAVTGKAAVREYERNNVIATRALVQACERAGVRHFVLMSSIAVTFPDRRYYPYAESKIAAEATVRQSSLKSTIVRPTMIFGPDSPVQQGLERLARLPFVPMFGGGRARVQPIHVTDVAHFLAALARRPDAAGEVVELGGPDVKELRQTISELRRLLGLESATRAVNVPLGALRWLLATLEKLGLAGVLPLTAGQLASFANDGCARPHPLVGAILGDRLTPPLGSRS